MMDQLLVLHLIQTLQMFLCDYAKFLQYCHLTALNHFGLRNQAHRPDAVTRVQPPP